MINETTADALQVPKREGELAKQPIYKQQRSFIGYSLLFAAVLGGWLLREEMLVNPEEGLGYWLGIIGGSMMLLLLFYPAGKKSKLLRRLGLVKHWFRVHMIFGLVGPLLVLYHCNFTVGAINSKVAFYSMIAVALSGIVGKHFYARIHRGLYGKRTSIEELRKELDDAMENNSGLGVILPNVVKDLHRYAGELLGDQFTKSLGIRLSLLWTIKHYYVKARLQLRIYRELQARSVVSPTIRNNAAQIRNKANSYVTTQVNLMRRVAQLSFYERLFSLWHILHMPLFLLLVISALVHVLAVHMY